MADTFISLIRMAAAGARGEAVQEEAVNWQELISLANEHGVLPLVAWAVKHSPQLKCSNEIREFLESRIFNTGMSNIIRRQRILYLINELQKEGIEVKLLEGYAIAQYYAHPDSREAMQSTISATPTRRTCWTLCRSCRRSWCVPVYSLRTMTLRLTRSWFPCSPVTCL